MQNDCILGSTRGPVHVNVVMKKFPSKSSKEKKSFLLFQNKNSEEIQDALRQHHHLVIHV
jgi:hypothetical protein